MNLTFAPKGRLQIDNARIIWRNFEGREDQYNRPGDRNFALVIDEGTIDGREVSAEEMAEALQEDKNRDGVGWNVKIKPPKEEGDQPFVFLTVKVKFNDRGPAIYLNSGRSSVQLDEESVARLDKIEIASVDLDIRPYDSEVHGTPYRTAYLERIWVTQNVDRFSARFAEEEHPEDDMPYDEE